MILSSNIIRNIREEYVATLSGIYDHAEVISIFRILCYEYLGLKPALTVFSLDESISAMALERMNNALIELLNNKPVQYIIGKADFFDLSLKVTEGVLIPRPETEELVKWILDDYSAIRDINILDIGTGSGCIAISLKKNIPDSKVHAMDVSNSALKCASENALLHDIEIEFIKINILNENLWGTLPGYDIIVSNPPYVRYSERKFMRSNVIDYEPASALFVDNSDPMIFYRKVMEFSGDHLNAGGKIYFELNEITGRELPELAEKYGYIDVEIRTDLRGKLRLAKILG